MSARIFPKWCLAETDADLPCACGATLSGKDSVRGICQARNARPEPKPFIEAITYQKYGPLDPTAKRAAKSGDRAMSCAGCLSPMGQLRNTGEVYCDKCWQSYPNDGEDATLICAATGTYCDHDECEPGACYRAMGMFQDEWDEF